MVVVDCRTSGDSNATSLSLVGGDEAVNGLLVWGRSSEIEGERGDRARLRESEEIERGGSGSGSERRGEEEEEQVAPHAGLG